MSETLHFLPWLRSGLALGIETAEADTLGPLPRNVDITGEVVLDGASASATLSLRPPDHVTAIDTSQISRRYPEPGVPDAEYGFFPHIEFVAPDLPWTASPAKPQETDVEAESTGRLRPWILLVCFEAPKGKLTPAIGGNPQTLTVDSNELPNLEESWGWAHVQSLEPPAGVPAAVEIPDGRIISRLVCPRKLAPNKRYRAALVAAWKHVGGMLHPAWEPDIGDVSLRVYDTWTFTTGDVGSFEELCERLGPLADKSLVFGVNHMDLTETGLLPPWTQAARPVRAHYSGALMDAEVKVEELEQGAKTEFETGVRDMIDAAGPRRIYDKTGPDPVVSIPFYGSFAKAVSAVPKSGWMGELNLEPRRRAAAGLGASIVRTHQERYMAEAWEQIGAIREVNRLLSQALLRRENAQSWKRRVGALDATQMMGVVKSQLTFVQAADGQPLRQKFAESTLPDGAVTNAISRALRPSFVIQKSFTAPLRDIPVPGQENPYANRRNWRGMMEPLVSTEDGRETLTERVPRAPEGMLTADPRRNTTATQPSGPPARPAVDLASLQTEVTDAIQPAAITRRQVELRVPALSTTLSGAAQDHTPSRITGGPVFSEALSDTLMQMSTELLMPGVMEFPNNTVHLVEADAAFAAALLAGANHEMARELLWREYPAATSHTCFQRFWARPDPSEVDIDAMSGWDLDETLEFHGEAGGESAVLLVRGDLLRQFPSARFLLLEPGKTEPIPPSFSGRIPPDIGFFGFDVPNKDAVTASDSKWAVIIEEPSFEPRFGLDAERDGGLTDYLELIWDDVAKMNDHVDIGNTPDLGLDHLAIWGLNAAHMAFATHQKPFRMFFRAPDIIGGGG